MRNHFCSRLLSGAAALLSVMLWAGCGDTFRPVVNPITPPGGTPQSVSSVNVISQGVPIPSTGTCFDGSAPPCPGSASVIDVSGDTPYADITIGRGPVLGSLSTSGLVLSANRADNTLSSYLPFSSTAATTISLPSSPVFVGGTESSVAYAALSSVNQVALINTSIPALTTTLPTGTNPVALAELPNNSEVFVANSGSGNVTVIQAPSQSVSATIPLSATGAVPIWVTVKSDNSAVYVLDQSGTIYIIDPISDQVVNTASAGARPACSSAGTPCGFMYFDPQLQRLYVPNPSDNTISAFDASNSSGTLTLVPLCPASTSSCTTSAIPTGGTNPVSLTAPTGTGRIYVANSGSNNVTVLNASSFAVKTLIPVGTNPVSIAASSDGSKVYAANQNATMSGTTVTQQPGTTIIATATDSVITTISAPFQNPSCTTDGAQCPRNTPVWVVGY